MSSFNLGNIQFSNKSKFVLLGGVNVLESRDFAYDAASYYKEICNKLDIPLIFKASYDKANRSSHNSFRGPGIKDGLKTLKKIKENIGIPVLTDVHTPEEAVIASKICDIIQIPAFLARQTDLVSAMAKTNAVINIKKPQFLSPNQMINIVNKFLEYGNNNLLVCERGTCFGYDNLIVDMLGIGLMKKTCNQIPIIFDVTHSLQCRDVGSISSGGRREQILELARAGLGTGLAGIFVETHTNPDHALCDGPSALPLEKIGSFLSQLKMLDNLIKSFPSIEMK